MSDEAVSLISERTGHVLTKVGSTGESKAAQVWRRFERLRWGLPLTRYYCTFTFNLTNCRQCLLARGSRCVGEGKMIETWRLIDAISMSSCGQAHSIEVVRSQPYRPSLWRSRCSLVKLPRAASRRRRGLFCEAKKSK
jgi:hypothetical protein